MFNVIFRNTFSQNRIHLIYTLVKDLEMGDKVALNVEKRSDPSQRGGKKFTKGEFIAFYGPVNGAKIWNNAGRRGGRGGRRGDRKVCT